MAYTTIPAGSGGLGTLTASVVKSTAGVASAATEGVDFNVAVSPAAVALYRARVLCGNTLTNVNGTDFDTDQWYTTTLIGAAATQAVTLLQTTDSGVAKVSTGATASRGIVMTPHGNPSYIANGRTSRWYFRARIQANTAVTAQTSLIVGLINPASPTTYPNVRLGVQGGIDATHFAWNVADNAGVNTSSGATSISIDNAWHTLEIWNDTTNVSFGIDLGSSTTATATTASSNVFAAQAFEPLAIAYNGTDAVTRDLWLDYMYMVTPGN